MGLHAGFVRAAIVLLGLACAGIAGAQPVSIAVDSALHEAPKADSRVVAQLKSGSTGEVIGRQSPWVNLKTASGTGWVLSFNVRFGGDGGGTQAGGGTAGALGRLVSGSTKPTTTAVIGIRGIDEEDVKNARFDAEQVNQLDRYAVSKADAERAARASGLEAVRVEYLNP